MSIDYYDNLRREQELLRQRDERIRREEQERRDRQLLEEQRQHDREARAAQAVHEHDLLSDPLDDIEFADHSHNPAEKKKKRLPIPFRDHVAKRISENYHANEALFIRRAVFFALVMLLLIAGLIYILTPLSDPLKLAAQPYLAIAADRIEWFKNADKKALYMTVMAFIIGKIGIFAWFYKQITGRDL